MNLGVIYILIGLTILLTIMLINTIIKYGIVVTVFYIGLALLIVGISVAIVGD